MLRRKRAGFVAQQQTSSTNGGVASAVGGLCEHGKVALDHIEKKSAKRATRVGGNDLDFEKARERVTAAKTSGHLTDAELNNMLAMVGGAESNGVWPVYETEPNHYVVFDARTRTTELDYACVKNDIVLPGTAPRRVTDGKNLMCRVRLRNVGGLGVAVE